MIDPKTRFVTAIMFELPAQEFERISRDTEEFAAREPISIPGLIVNAVLGNEQKTQLLVISQWESKDAYGVSRWNAEIQQKLGDLVQASSSFDIRTFVPIAQLK